MTSTRLLIILLLTAFACQSLAQSQNQLAVEAIAKSSNRITVYWNRQPSALSYSILRDGAFIANVAATENLFEDNTVAPNHVYSYQVRPNLQGRDISDPNSKPYLERSFPLLPAIRQCDLLVVGATSAGVAAAVSGARQGLDVVLIEETRRLGGMPVNGLGQTDIRKLSDSSGFFEEFRQKVKSLYGTGEGLQYEPRIAHRAMKELLWAEKNLEVFREVHPTSVRTNNRKITEVSAETVTTGKAIRFLPKMVVDATECGDVAAWAGAPFRLGRESRSAREPHAGHLYYDRLKDAPLPGSTGRADDHVQAYSYLMVAKDFGKNADKTIPIPPGYDPKKYAHTPKWEDSWAATSGKLPNSKFEINQHPQGGDLQGINYKYPLANYADRKKIEQEYKNHALGYLYYIQTVQGKKNIGLSEDDYRDTDNWPPLLYIREARRFEAETTLDEHDITRSRDVFRSNSIGIGDYPMDSHATQPKTDWTRGDMGEGEFYLPKQTPWHQVPYQIMIPKSVENVFVPTAVSATHVAYGTVRLEPVRMQLGDAAAIACRICIQTGLTPLEVPARQIQTALVSRHSARTITPNNRMETPIRDSESGDRAILYQFSDVPSTHRKYRSIQWLASRGFYPAYEIAGATSTSGTEAGPLHPDEPISIHESLRLIQKLADRTGIAWKKPSSPGSESQNLSRANGAALLTGFMHWNVLDTKSQHYSDTPSGSTHYVAAEALYANWIDTRNWEDVWKVDASGRLKFDPDKPLTNAQFAELIYIAALHFGPLYYDHPMDMMRGVRP